MAEKCGAVTLRARHSPRRLWRCRRQVSLGDDGSHALLGQAGALDVEDIKARYKFLTRSPHVIPLREIFERIGKNQGND